MATLYVVSADGALIEDLGEHPDEEVLGLDGLDMSGVDDARVQASFNSWTNKEKIGGVPIEDCYPLKLKVLGVAE